jgi:hypothetical protein
MARGVTLMQPQTSVVHLSDLRERRRQRIARELLRWPIWTDMPQGNGRPVAAAFVRRGKSFDFLASPRLNDVELKIAAYACAVKSELGDECEGVHFDTVDKVRMMTAETAASIGNDLRAWVDFRYLGVGR